MTPAQASAKIAKLRAHAAAGATAEAPAYRATTDKLAAAHGLPQTPTPTSTPRHPTVGTGRKEPHVNTATTPRTTGNGPQAHPDTLRQAFNPRIRAGFGRNDTPGDTISGPIVGVEEEPDIDYITKAPKHNPDGTPRKVPVLIIQTDGTTNPHGPGLRKIWVRTGLADALITAVQAAGVHHPAPGDTLTITYTGTGTPLAPGFAPPKNYTATYHPTRNTTARR